MFWFIVVQNKVINLLELLLGRYSFLVCMCVVGSDECARAVAMSSSVFKVYVPGEM